MTQYRISGGRALYGTLTAGGAKNALLPILAATLLYGGPCELHRCPNLTDVDNTLEILRYLGAKVRVCGDVITVDTARVNRFDIPQTLMHRCRASICFLAPLLHRFGKCEIAYPGGCKIGKRPIDYHLAVLQALGSFEIRENEKSLTVSGRFNGGNFRLPYPSVGATECALMAAAFAKMPCMISGAAGEPEVMDLMHFLNACGARLSVSDGRPDLFFSSPVPFRFHAKPVLHTVIPDRIETGTYALAAAATRGSVVIRSCNPQDLCALLSFLRECGADVRTGEDVLAVSARGRRLQSVPLLTAGPHPAFPTDLQAPACAFLATCPGKSIVLDTVFPDRYTHLTELRKFGAAAWDRRTPGGERYALLEGRMLSGAQAAGGDLRAGAALLIAGLCAKGKSLISDNGYIARGYDGICEKLRSLGADVRKI